MLIEGARERMRTKKVFTASYLTAPILNAGHPKRPIRAQQIVPEEFRHEEAEASPEQVDRLSRLADEQERRRKHGQS